MSITTLPSKYTSNSRNLLETKVDIKKVFFKNNNNSKQCKVFFPSDNWKPRSTKKQVTTFFPLSYLRGNYLIILCNCSIV